MYMNKSYKLGVLIRNTAIISQLFMWGAGFPTANFSEEVISRLPSELVGGIYWGLASVDRGPVYGMVMSIGWNPFYKALFQTVFLSVLFSLWIRIPLSKLIRLLIQPKKSIRIRIS